MVPVWLKGFLVGASYGFFVCATAWLFVELFFDLTFRSSGMLGWAVLYFAVASFCAGVAYEWSTSDEEEEVLSNAEL